MGDDISSLELDVRREVAEFATVFIEVAKRTRTPSDVLLNQKIGSLHKRIACIQEQLERLPTLEGIRTEIARLAVENYPALPGTATENQCRAIALAQQMRGWFETLGYTLEKYEIWAEEYFEWIINIPVRRGYDRILIRGVAGEVGLSDVMALRSSIEAQKTDEGCLVTTRRISRAARDEKLLIICWRSTFAAISSKPSKMSSNLPMRLSWSKTSLLMRILCWLKKKPAKTFSTFSALAKSRRVITKGRRGRSTPRFWASR